MQHSVKYLIQADIRTSGVVERSDVVGAVFGQTEGLLGDDLDLRKLQESSKVGRIDVEIETEGGRSFGTITIGTALDRVETAVLAASLETIDRVGPSRAECTVSKLLDARAAKRNAIVERATTLLSQFEEKTTTGDTLVEEVREKANADALTEHDGLPAGPRVGDSDALIVVEGRADVRRLLEYGIKNAIAVEGTDVPDAVARLSRDRTTTAFLDGDRGGDLILRELQQVGDVDHVAFAPTDESVEDLDYATIRGALEKKLPAEQVADGTTPREAFAPTDGGTVEPVETTGTDTDNGSTDETATPGQPSTGGTGTEDDPADETTAHGEASADDGNDGSESTPEPETLAGHVETVVGGETGRARLLDESFDVLAETDADDVFETVAESDETPRSVVFDGTVSQRVLDIAAQRGVGQVVGTEAGEFVKQPTSVRVRTAADFE